MPTSPPYTRGTFLGLSVRDFNSQVALGRGSVSTLNVQLVQDPTNGDVFPTEAYRESIIGKPIYFQFYAYQFYGLVQKFEERKERDGLPTFDCVCVDPREILDGTEIIISQYNGTVTGVPNLVNVYGYYENTFGFGASLVNDTGMPWNYIYAALNGICNTAGGGIYGGPLNYRGVQYGLDLSELPVPPVFYRIGGVSVNLLEAIAQICEDGACDFYVELIGFTIKVRTISRRYQPPLGTITALTNSFYGNSVVRSSSGLESRNEITSSFLVGGDQTNLNITNSYESFWGYDVNNEPIFGTPSSININGTEHSCEIMSLNAGPIADIIGGTTYLSSTIEMRLAMYSYDAWATYVGLNKPAIAALIFSPFLPAAPLAGIVLKEDLINDAPAALKKLNQGLRLNAINSDFINRQQRLYEFIRGTANEYYGRQFAVYIPFVLSKVDPETLKVTYSQEPTDGAYVPDGSTPFGIPDLFASTFQTQDGRYVSMAAFDFISGADLSKVSLSDSLIQPTPGYPGVKSLYTKTQVNGQVILTPSPVVIVTLSSPLFYKPVDAVGDFAIITAVTNGTPEILKDLARRAGTGTISSLKIWPEAAYPNNFAVALKSNILTYGPWYSIGAPGKVKFEADPSLTPWNYGTIDIMNQAGNARVATTINDMQTSEAGVLELAGTPTVSLGQALSAGGPNVSNIRVTEGKDGFTTSYSFATFTPRFGVFNKGLDKRLQRMGQNSQEIKRTLRQAMRLNLLNQETINQAAAGAKANRGFLQGAPKAVVQQSPYGLLSIQNLVRGDGTVRVGGSVMEIDEALGSIPIPQDDDDAGTASSLNKEYQSMAIASLASVVRPFSTNYAAPGVISHYQAPSGGSHAVTSDLINPFGAANDFEVFLWGNQYEGMVAAKHSPDNSDARSMAIRGPLILTGWGYNTDGDIVPKGTNVYKHSDKWKTGPVDLLWDEWRTCWTSHDLTYGKIKDDDIAPGDTGKMTIYSQDEATHRDLIVVNRGNSTYHAGDKAVGAYSPDGNEWFLMPQKESGAGIGVGLASGSHLVSIQSGIYNVLFDEVDAFTAGIFTNPDGVSGPTVKVGLLDFALGRHGLVPNPTYASGRFLGDDGGWHYGPSAFSLTVGNPLVSGINRMVFASGDSFLVTSPSSGVVNIGLSDFTRSQHGLVPNPGGSGLLRFLREDGTWIAPSGSTGGGSPLAVSDQTTVVSGVVRIEFDHSAGFNVNNDGGGEALVSQYVFNYNTNGCVPNPGASGHTRLLREDGTWVNPSGFALTVQDDTLTTVVDGCSTLAFDTSVGFTVSNDGIGSALVSQSVFGPAGGGHSKGCVPAPSVTPGSTHFLCENGTWALLPSGNTYFTFPSGGGIATSGSGPTTLSIIWGTTAQSVGTVNLPGTANSSSRSDHVHAHGTFGSGNYHPEYLITVQDVDMTTFVNPTKTFAFDNLAGMTVSGVGTTATISQIVFSRSVDGRVPHPAGSGVVRFLREDSTWGTPSGTLLTVQDDLLNTVVDPTTTLAFNTSDGFSVTNDGFGSALVGLSGGTTVSLVTNVCPVYATAPAASVPGNPTNIPSNLQSDIIGAPGTVLGGIGNTGGTTLSFVPLPVGQVTFALIQGVV